MEMINRMQPVLEARRLANHILTSQTDAFADPETNIRNLRTALTFEKARLSERGYRYLCREIGYLLPHNRSIRMAFRENPDMIRGGRLASRIMKEDSTESNIVSERRDLAVQPEERDTVRQLIEGKHLSEIDNLTVSPLTLTCAMELYPLDTLRWMKAYKPEAIDQNFAASLGRNTVLGINAYDIEQFDPKDLKAELPASLRAAYDKGLKEAQFKTSTNVEEMKDRFAKRPLPTHSDETRRNLNAVVSESQDAGLQNLLAFSSAQGKKMQEAMSTALLNQLETTRREYNYNVSGPTPWMANVKRAKEQVAFMQANNLQRISYDGKFERRKFQPNPDGYEGIYRTTFCKQNELMNDMSGMRYQWGGKFADISKEHPHAPKNGVDCSGLTAWNARIFFDLMNKISMEKYNVKIFPDKLVKQFGSGQMGSIQIMDICRKTKINGRLPKIFSSSIPKTEDLEKSPYNCMILQLPPRTDEKGKTKPGHIVMAVREPKTGKFLVYESSNDVHILPYEKWRRTEIKKHRTDYSAIGLEELADHKALAQIAQMQSEDNMRQEDQEAPLFNRASQEMPGQLPSFVEMKA